MPRGGKREGAGRKHGVPNKASQARQAKIEATGATPLDVMIAAMRKYVEAEDLDKAASFAKDAAPYVHPRLTAVEATGKDGEPLIPEGSSNRTLAMAILSLLRGSVQSDDEQGRPDTGAAGEERGGETAH